MGDEKRKGSFSDGRGSVLAVGIVEDRNRGAEKFKRREWGDRELAGNMERDSEDQKRME